MEDTTRRERMKLLALMYGTLVLLYAVIGGLFALAIWLLL